MTFRIRTGLAVLFRTMLCAVVVLAAPGAVMRRTSAGKLDQARSEVRDGDDRKPRKSNRRNSRDDECDHDHLHGCDDGEDVFDDLIGNAVLFAVSSPWWLPRMAVADEGLRATFPPAPYAEKHPGYLVIDPIDPTGTHAWSLRLSSEYGTDFDDLDRIGTRLLVDTSSRFGFDTEWNQWLVETTGAGSDDLATGDFNLVYRFAQHERIQFHSGLGMNWLADDAGSDFGVNFTWGLQAFPRDPFVVDAVIDVGSLGDAFLFHLRTMGGVVWGPAEIFAGYDYHRIGRTDLQGVLAGVRFWF